jgi:hypothetical protein
MARVFAVMVQILLRAGANAVQVWAEPQIYPRLQIWWHALVQCRGTSYLEARYLSRCKILIAAGCACPGTRTIIKLSSVQEHLPAGRQESKKCDEQLTHIVRVSVSLFIKNPLF